MELGTRDRYLPLLSCHGPRRLRKDRGTRKDKGGERGQRMRDVEGMLCAGERMDRMVDREVKGK